ncbi:GNAT family N-acetyltransferase [Achromobacter seleniivolatilans]|uniref:GNAT family N-acetyltransferase n=1 Tax=Achromobacter seleniivolatilans TaxID=3047478 RepID=A0ABY9M4H5_9BURK|nr:GNAT family N-acetyltransferase [Achromobacter sp. R39]WMD21528.1 GNAT family N-acetyltransferase [Achromobacter sp. R39]
MKSALPHPLDNPVWTALSTAQTHLRQGDGLACRYPSDVAPFAALETHTPDAWQALGRLLLPGEQVALLSEAPAAPGPQFGTQSVGVIHQMMAGGQALANVNRPDARTLAPADLKHPDSMTLTLADAQDMLDLAQKTKPGPFCARTREMGRYIGIRDQGRLVAMAGERMHPAGYVEISAVCVDQDWRGKGIAGRLISQLHARILQRGETPFLHVLSTNHNAIALYERLGFTLRKTFFLTLIGHAK